MLPFFQAKEPLGKHMPFLPNQGLLCTFNMGRNLSLESSCPHLFLLNAIYLPLVYPPVPVNQWNFRTCCSPPEFPWILSTSSFYNKYFFLSWRVCKPGVRRKATCLHYSQFTVKLEQLTTTLPRTLTTERKLSDNTEFIMTDFQSM